MRIYVGGRNTKVGLGPIGLVLALPFFLVWAVGMALFVVGVAVVEIVRFVHAQRKVAQ